MKLLALGILFAISTCAFGQQDSTKVFVVVDQSAEFPGGIDNFYSYLNKNMRFDKETKKQRKAGKIFVEFVVKEDGSVDKQSVRIVPPVAGSSDPTQKGVDMPDEVDQEVIRVISECPKWIPGKRMNQPVHQRFVLPVKLK
jgi:periplasmic protein TonB